ncbi:indolepyruvate ferredoxin oxidoreductase family protein [Cumulibacter manganitolerans]|uniref:indolepyruvate ferredoxin oxidoreductase family protein n=1 Tax=Cumulibacter manganitolerans TaxID=1884992 RepID=UPI001295763B|nr:indolepyruvate ferredoxin oxidoreductase family protein [Cumulibacter manganitolerans]
MTSVADPTRPDTDTPARTPRQEILTGTEAVVRLLIEQAKADRRAGRNTGGFASGYPGSPVARIHDLLEEQRDALAAHGIHPAAGLNEELAATAVWGSQTVTGLESAQVDGVFALWYGKAPGVDRAGDALHHGNIRGASPHGGVLVVAGDDPKPNATVYPSDSTATLASWGMPVLYPGNMQEVLDLGLHGYALSRASALWVGMKLVTDVADGSATVDLDPDRIAPVVPALTLDGAPFVPKIRINDAGVGMLEAERDLYLGRLAMAAEYARVNDLNPVHSGDQRATVGLVAPGKTYYDLRQALDRLGLDDARLTEHGIRLKQVRLLHPLSPREWTDFAAGLDEIIVVEEKQPLLERQLKDVYYAAEHRPTLVGRHTPEGAEFLPVGGELGIDQIARIVGNRLRETHNLVLDEPARQPRVRPLLPLATARTGFFCSGCPHSTSLRAPKDAQVGAGIGCHIMGLLIDRDEYGDIRSYTQMGGEGAQWVGMQPFAADKHLIQNLGDGTYHHSGSLAVRQAISAGVNITYKLLVNGTVGMTGGQDISGGMRVPDLVRELLAEGVARIAITTEDPARYRRVRLPRGVKVHHRDALMDVQEELRAVPGVTVLIHDQECASERRRRWRAEGSKPTTRVVINERVCEGCGDCNVQSQCLSVQPTTTPFGRKNTIHQSSCNLDFSCVKGDCPSFMTVEVKNARKDRVTAPEPPAVPEPSKLARASELNVQLAGIGGTGVVSVSRVLAAAAALEGRQARALDLTGSTIKAGPVVSHIHIRDTDTAAPSKLDAGSADLFIAFDLLTAVTPENLLAASPRRTVLVASTSAVPTAQMAIDSTVRYPALAELRSQIDAVTRHEHNAYLDVEQIAGALFGNHMAGNALLLGVAYQRGAIPMSSDSIEQAIREDGIAVEQNLSAFRWGRALVHDPQLVAGLAPDANAAGHGLLDAASRALIAGVGAEGALAELLAVRIPDLIGYQNRRYAQEYADLVARAKRAEDAIGGDGSFAETVAIQAHRLMAYKDEYEVARLHLLDSARMQVEGEFGTGATVSWNLQPPILNGLGLTRKVRLGPWFAPALGALTGLKRLRGTVADPFGRAVVRRLERELAAHYRELIESVSAALTAGNHAHAVELAGTADVIRGYEQVKLRNVAEYQDRVRRAAAPVGVPVPRLDRIDTLTTKGRQHAADH